MESIQSVSNGDLTLEMLEQAALELGRFQGKHSGKTDTLNNINCLGDSGFLEREFNQWHTQTFTYDFLVSEPRSPLEKSRTHLSVHFSVHSPSRMPKFLKQILKDGNIQLVDGMNILKKIIGGWVHSKKYMN